jgi:hypothetical protein
MKNFLAIYRGEPGQGTKAWNELSPEQKEKRTQQGMEAWGQWMTDHSSKIIVPGGPLGKTLQVSREGITPVVNRDCGFVLVEAENHEAAAKMFLKHPHFSIFPGENVEIMECLAIPK